MSVPIGFSNTLEELDLCLNVGQLLEFWDEMKHRLDVQSIVDSGEYLDTCDREDIYSAVGRKLVGRNWPMYGEGPEVYDDFLKKYHAEAKRLGILKEGI